jgi:hypothetical protein
VKGFKDYSNDYPYLIYGMDNDFADNIINSSKLLSDFLNDPNNYALKYDDVNNHFKNILHYNKCGYVIKLFLKRNDKVPTFDSDNINYIMAIINHYFKFGFEITPTLRHYFYNVLNNNLLTYMNLLETNKIKIEKAKNEIQLYYTIDITKLDHDHYQNLLHKFIKLYLNTEPNVSGQTNIIGQFVPYNKIEKIIEYYNKKINDIDPDAYFYKETQTAKKYKKYIETYMDSFDNYKEFIIQFNIRKALNDYENNKEVLKINLTEYEDIIKNINSLLNKLK